MELRRRAGQQAGTLSRPRARLPAPSQKQTPSRISLPQYGSAPRQVTIDDQRRAAAGVPGPLGRTDDEPWRGGVEGTARRAARLEAGRDQARSGVGAGVAGSYKTEDITGGSNADWATGRTCERRRVRAALPAPWFIPRTRLVTLTRDDSDRRGLLQIRRRHRRHHGIGRRLACMTRTGEQRRAPRQVAPAPATRQTSRSPPDDSSAALPRHFRRRRAEKQHQPGDASSTPHLNDGRRLLSSSLR